ncbi:MAG: serine hydrolase [Alphaproteobacteria bacterium]|nr:serine hydrolase [Alphaproteobacteria bacterium]
MTASGKLLAGFCAAALLAGCAVRDDTGIAGTVSSPQAVLGADWPDYGEASVPSGFSPAGVAALEARMARFVADGDTPGIATLLVRDGEVVSHVQAGLADVETGAPVDEDTIYRIYSMTKPVTGVALMMLYEEGAFSLDDPVSKFIPEFRDLQVLGASGAEGEWTLEPLNRQPTLRELMSHTAGFAYGLYGDDPANAAFRDGQIMASPDLDSFIDRVAGVPLLYQPGEDWFYSAAVDIQGAIIERITGQSLGEFFDERLFGPLGMDDTGFYVPAEDGERLADLFAVNPENGAVVPYESPETAFRKETVAMESGGGGLVSTLDDYARFCQMLASGGALDGVRILQPETVELMRTDVLPDGVTIDLAGTLGEEQATSAKFGLDFGVYTDTEASDLPFGEGTYYWGGAAGTWFWIDPENDLFFIGMIQLFDQNDPNPTDFWSISAEKVYGALEE